MQGQRNEMTVQHESNKAIPYNQGKIEAFFKSVKYGTLSRRKRLRPQQYLCHNLTDDIGNLKKINLTPTQKKFIPKKHVAMDDIREIWKNRGNRGKRTYHHPGVARKILSLNKSKKNCIKKRPKKYVGRTKKQLNKEKNREHDRYNV